MRTRLAIEDKLHLEPTQPWVEVPSALLLHSGGRTFEIKVSCHPGYLVCRIQAGMHASSHCSSISLCTLCSQSWHKLQKAMVVCASEVWKAYHAPGLTQSKRYVTGGRWKSAGGTTLC